MSCNISEQAARSQYIHPIKETESSHDRGWPVVAEVDGEGYVGQPASITQLLDVGEEVGNHAGGLVLGAFNVDHLYEAAIMCELWFSDSQTLLLSEVNKEMLVSHESLYG